MLIFKASIYSLFPAILFLTACSGKTSGDNTPPVVTAPPDITVEATSTEGTVSSDSTISAFLLGSSAIDDIDSTLVFSHNAPVVFPFGTTLVTFTYTDSSSNSGKATASVEVIDTTPPLVSAPNNLIVEGPGTAEIITFLAGANVTDIADISPILSHNAPSVFPLGDTLVIFTFTDASGNVASDTATVTITDTTAPVVKAPDDTLVEATSAAGTPINDTTIANFLANSTVTDNVDPAPILSHNAPSVFPLGVTQVEFTFTDEAGNASSDNAKITVIDSTAPIVMAPGDASVEAQSAAGTVATSGAIVSLLEGSDAVDSVDSSPVMSHNAPTQFPIGPTEVTFTYTDFSGNTASDKTTITVVDTTGPTVTPPADITVEAPGTAAITTFLISATASDLVDPSPVITNDAADSLPLGTTTVTFTATDASGNTSSDSASVTLTDTTAPSVTAPDDITIEADSAAGTAYTQVDITNFLLGSSATDNVDTPPILSTNAPTVFPLGITQVIFTYTDASGNEGFSSANVTVSDTTPPVITLVGADTLTVDLNSSYSELGTTVFDAVDSSLVTSVTGTVNTALVGAYILNYDVTDNAGNVANSVQRTVNVEVAAPTNVAYSVSGKHLNFSWDASSAQNKFRILENPNGASGFTVASGAGNIAETAIGYSLEIPVHLTDWVNAQFIVEACDTGETQCKSSSILSVIPSDSIPAIVYVKASNPDNADFFGRTVALSGDGSTLVVGTEYEDSAATGVDGDDTDNTAEYSGAAYVFVKDGTSWVQQAYIKASNAEANDRFGYSVSLSADGNTLAVGAIGEYSNATGIDGDQTNNSASDSGAVYIFSRSGNTWIQQAYIKASNSYSQDNFGFVVSLSNDGNTLAASSYGEDSNTTGVNGDESNNTAVGSGAAYVFTRSGSTWSQQAYIKASNTGTYYDLFGSAMDLSGDGNTLAVGAYQEDSNATGINGDENNESASSAGAVYVFRRSGSIWSQQVYVKASNAESLDKFGFSVALNSDGNTLAVGAYNEDSGATGVNGDGADNSTLLSGSAYVFTRNGSSWSQQAYLKSSNTQASDGFGAALSLNANGDVLVIGAQSEDGGAPGIDGDQLDDSEIGSGAAYLFTRNGSTWAQKAYIKSSTPQISDTFGSVTSIALDDIGDSLAISATGEDSNATGIDGDQTDNSVSNAGAVYIY